jgi:hypothetical protein
MKSFAVLGAAMAGALLLSNAFADEPLKSGPQEGQTIPGVFHPLNVTGPSAGEKACQI